MLSLVTLLIGVQLATSFLILVTLGSQVFFYLLNSFSRRSLLGMLCYLLLLMVLGDTVLCMDNKTSVVMSPAHCVLSQHRALVISDGDILQHSLVVHCGFSLFIQNQHFDITTIDFVVAVRFLLLLLLLTATTIYYCYYYYYLLVLVL